MRPREIKTHFDKNSLGDLRFGGWLQGKLTYLWIGGRGGNTAIFDTLSGQRLYRLAKAIVKQFEAEKPYKRK